MSDVGLKLQGAPSPQIQEMLGRWDTLAPDVQDRLTRAGYAPQSSQPHGNRQDFLNDMKSYGKTALQTGLEVGLPAAVGLPPESGLLARAAGAGITSLIGHVTGKALTGETPTGEGAAYAGAGGAAGETVASGVLGALRSIFGVNSGGAVGLARRQAAKEMGIDPLAADVSEQAGALTGDLSRTATGGPTVASATARRGQQTAQAYETNVLAPLGGRRELSDAGAAVQEIAKPALRAKKAQGRLLYRNAETEAARIGLQVNVPTSVMKTADDMLAELDQGLEVAQPQRLRKVLNELTGRGKPTTSTSQIVTPGSSPTVAGAAAGAQPITTTTPAPPLSFQELVRIKRDLNEILPGFEQRGFAKTFGTGAEERLAGELDYLIDNTAKGTSVEPAWQAARDYWRDEVVPLRKVAEGLAPKYDDEIVNALILANRPDKVRIMFKNMPPDRANEVRAAWFTRAFDQSTNEQGVFNAQRFLSRWDALGNQVQAELAGGRPEVAKLVDVLRGQVSGAQAGMNPSQSGRAVMRAAQLAALARSGYQNYGEEGGLKNFATDAALTAGLPFAAAAGMTSGPMASLAAPGRLAQSLGGFLARLPFQAAASRTSRSLSEASARRRMENR